MFMCPSSQYTLLVVMHKGLVTVIQRSETQKAMYLWRRMRQSHGRSLAGYLDSVYLSPHCYTKKSNYLKSHATHQLIYACFQLSPNLKYWALIKFPLNLLTASQIPHEASKYSEFHLYIIMYHPDQTTGQLSIMV